MRKIILLLTLAAILTSCKEGESENVEKQNLDINRTCEIWMKSKMELETQRYYDAISSNIVDTFWSAKNKFLTERMKELERNEGDIIIKETTIDNSGREDIKSRIDHSDDQITGYIVEHIFTFKEESGTVYLLLSPDKQKVLRTTYSPHDYHMIYD